MGRACLPRHARLWPACHAMAWHSDEQKEIRWHLVRVKGGKWGGTEGEGGRVG